MSNSGRYGRILRRRGQYASVKQYLAGQYGPLPLPIRDPGDDSTVHEFALGPAVEGHTEPATRLEDYDRPPEDR